MSYGLLLDLGCIRVASKTIEIHFLIYYCNVFFLLLHVDSLMHLTLFIKTPWGKPHLSLFILFSGLFASNYTETHYLEDGTVVTGSHNFTVCFFYSFNHN